MSSYPPFYAYPSAPPVERAVPRPPRLHWGWVLLLQIVTRGLFELVWLIVQANWVRRVHGKSRAFILSIVLISMMPIAVLYGAFMGAITTALGRPMDEIAPAVVGVTMVGFLVVRVWTVFRLRTELELSPISIPLSGAMTFFFGAIYFQYHLRDWESNAETDGLSLGLSSAKPPVFDGPENAA